MKLNGYLSRLGSLFTILILIPCQTVFAQQPAVPDASAMGNRFFVLDFADPAFDMSVLKSTFFTTYPHNDPTHGDVVYDRRLWENKDILRLKKNDGLYCYVKARADSNAFDSFRLTSKAYFNLNENTPAILFVFKGRLPSGRGVWPAWWLLGSRESAWLYGGNKQTPTDSDLDSFSGKGHFYDTPSPANATDWPAAGEIDIVETINGDNVIHNTIHTCPQMCDSEWNNNGEIINCANADASDPNAGCSGFPFRLAEPQGTFACVWESHHIRFYYWEPGSKVRTDHGPLGAHPNPEQWSPTNLKNEVRFLETDIECDSALHQQWQCANCAGKESCSFVNLKMIFNTTLCGKWAGSRFDNFGNSTGNCQEFIRHEGRQQIHNQFMKLEYVAVRKL